MTYASEYPGVVALDSAATESGFVVHKNYVCIDALGRRLVIWLLSDGSAYRLSTSTNSGSTWTHESLTDSFTHRYSGASIAAKGNGGIAVFVSAREATDTKYQIYYKERSVTGAWSSWAKVSTDASNHHYHPIGLYDHANKLHVIWSRATASYFLLSYSTNEAGAWPLSPEDVGVSSPGGNTNHHVLALNLAGGLCYAFSQKDAGDAHTHVWYRYRPPGGPWGSLVDVSGDGDGTYGFDSYEQGYPSIFVDTSGLIHLTWEGYHSASTTYQRPCYAMSADDGASWVYAVVPETANYHLAPGVVPFVEDITGTIYIFYAIRPTFNVILKEAVSLNLGLSWNLRAITPTISDDLIYAAGFSNVFPAGVRREGGWELLNYETDTDLAYHRARATEEVKISQMVVEAEVPGDHFRVSQMVVETEVTGIPEGPYFLLNSRLAGDIVKDSWTMDAEIAGITTQGGVFSLNAVIHPVSTTHRQFNLNAVIEAARQFNLNATILGTVPCPTVNYGRSDGDLEVYLLNWDMQEIDYLDYLTSITYTREVNGMGHHGYGTFKLTAPQASVDVDKFKLDHIVRIYRTSTAYGAVKEFEGFIRIVRPYQDSDGVPMYEIGGVDLKALMKTRIVLPFPSTQAFTDVYDNFTDIMRLLVLTNGQAPAGVSRWMYRLKVEPDTHQGEWLDMHYRHTLLNEDLDDLADLGADWDVETVGDYLWFKVFYPYKGRDRRRTNACGERPLVFSVDLDNLLAVSVTKDRSKEVTVVYVAGDGVGIDREIVERHNIADRENDSPWNRREAFLERSKESSEGTLAALGDAHLVENGISFEFTADIPTFGPYGYGVWNLGDVCTGIYGGETFDMRIVSVAVTKNAGSPIEVKPTFLIYPRLEDY